MLSNLPLQVLLYLNGWYDVLYTVLMLLLYLWKGTTFPYPGDLGSLLVLEVCLVVALAVLEYFRIFLASRGNKAEKTAPLVVSDVISLVCALSFFYFLYWQIYVTRADVVLGCIGLAFIGLELIASFFLLITLSTTSQTTAVESS